MSGLTYMCPALSGQDAVNLRLPYTEAFCNLPLGHRSLKALDHRNLISGQFRAAMKLPFARDTKASAVSVLSIFASSAPLQIIHAIVRFITILVVDLVSRRRGRADEDLSHNPVNKFRMIFPVLVESSPDIPASIKSRRENYWLPLDRANYSIRRNIVSFFKSNNRKPNTHLTIPIFLDALGVSWVSLLRQQVIKGDLH